MNLDGFNLNIFALIDQNIIEHAAMTQDAHLLESRTPKSKKNKHILIIC